MPTTKKIRPKTPNRGAADIVAEVMAKVKRMRTFCPGVIKYIERDQLVAWLADWDVRAAKKAGGLGRK